MRGIVIKSVSKKGNDALRRNQEETRGAGFLARQQMRSVYKVRYEGDDVYHRLYLFCRSKYITPNLTRPVAYDMMVANGAAENIDFVIDEVEE